MVFAKLLSIGFDYQISVTPPMAGLKDPLSWANAWALRLWSNGSGVRRVG